MARNSGAAAAGAQLEFALEPAAAHAAPNNSTFDLHSGMPLTRAAARSMNTAAIRTTLVKALEALRERSAPTPTDAFTDSVGAALLDSLEVVWLKAKFDQFFDKPLVDLTKVPETRWSTLDALADLLHESMGELS